MIEKIMLLIASTLNLSDEPARTDLWRNLIEGDTPGAVAAKLENMAEVKRVKTKMRRGELREQDINMVDDGVIIFDVGFAIATEYDDLHLNKVQLSSSQVCANASYEFSSKIAYELERKYSLVIEPAADEYEFSSASFEANPNNSPTLTSVFSDGETTAVLSTQFFRNDPPRYAGGGALARSLYQIARATYESQAARCGGTGNRTARVRVTYVSNATFDALIAEAEDDADLASEEAANNL